MITTPDLAELWRRQGIGWHVATVQLSQIDAYLDRFPPRESWSQRLIRHCQLCGARNAETFRRGIVRCEKHVGRNGCVVEGCRRTWATDDYEVRFICGRHWRMAPQRMRDVEAKVRRLARKHGWTEQLAERHHRIWERCIRAVNAALAGDIDMDEINRLMGWDQAA